MIHVVQGPDTAVAGSLENRLVEHPETLVLPGVDGASRSWNGVRGALATARGRLSDASFDALLARHPVAARLLLPEHPHALDAVAEARCGEVQARLVSHLSHNWAINRPVFSAAADLLADLATSLGASLAVRQLAALDWETTWTLRSLYRLHDEAAPALWLGYDPTYPTPSLDERGLLWRMAPTTVRETLLSFRARASTVVEAVREGAPHDPTFGLRITDVVGDPEATAFDHLASEGALTATQVQRIVTAQLASFRRFGFASAIGLGLGLLEREATLDDASRAQVHGIVGLSAHNRQFHTAGNHVLTAFLETQFTLALQHEERPDRRAAILYRLAVTTGRRKGDIEACLGWCRQAREELAVADLPMVRHAHLDAWIGNIGAYGLMRQKHFDKALAETRRGFDGLTAARAFALGEGNAGPIPWSREMNGTHSLLAHNQAVLSARLGDWEGYVRWRRRGTALETEEDGAARFEVGYWIDWYRNQSRLDLALPEALEGLRSAEAELDIGKVYRYSLEAADLAYRLGRAEEADDRFRAACDLRQRLGDPIELVPVALPSSSARARAGRIEEARSILESHADGGEAASRDADVLAALGRLAAAQGSADEAESWMDAAIESALAGGARDVLVRTAIAAAEASATLGRKDDAVQAYRQAIEIAAVDAAQHPPAPAELLAAHVGLAETEALPISVDHLSEAVALVEPALRDAETWWRLPRLVSCLAASMRERPESRSALDETGIAVLLDAAGQRREADGALAADLSFLHGVFPQAAKQVADA